MTSKIVPPIVFLAFANDLKPTGRYLHNLPKEARQLRECIESLEREGKCKLVLRQNITLDEFLEVLRTYRNRISLFHFSGHAGDAELLFSTSDGSNQPAYAEGVAGLLSEQPGLRLVFLNGCATEGHIEGLFAAGIPAVLATSEFIDDEVATKFSTEFYKVLVEGETVETAYRLAQEAIRTEKDDDPCDAYCVDAKCDEESPWPWKLRIAPEAANLLKRWTLPGVHEDPYFELPPLPPMDLPKNPYKNLEPFTEKDAPIFFGRGWQIRRLFLALTVKDGNPVVLLHGAAGVGKSSVLAAGLKPRLEAIHTVEYLGRQPGVGLAEGLTILFNGATDLREAWCRREQERPLTVILDQVEEMWANPLPGEEEVEFRQTLKQIFGVREERPQGRLLLSFRKEWLAEVEAMLDSVDLRWRSIDLWRLNRAGILEAVEGPAGIDHYGLKLDEELPSVIADQLEEDPDAVIAPALQILLGKMWSQVKSQRHSCFTLELYRSLRRGGRWLDEFFDEQIVEIAKKRESGVSSGLVFDLLAFHTTPLSTATSRSKAELVAHYEESRWNEVAGIVKECKDLYLLSDPVDPEALETSRLAHDVLAPIVRDAFERSDRPGQRARRIFESRAVEWRGGEEGAPLDEFDLKLVETGLVGMRSLFPDEERLWKASLLEKRRRRRVSLSYLAVVTLMILGIFAFASRLIDTRRIGAETLASLEENLDQSLLWGLEAYTREPSGEGRNHLAAAIVHDPFLETFIHGHEGFVREAVFHENKNLLASGSADGKVAVWDLGPPVVLHSKPEVTSGCEVSSRPLAFSPDGRMLAYSDGGCVKFWDLELRKPWNSPHELLCQFEHGGVEGKNRCCDEKDVKCLEDVGKEGPKRLFSLAWGPRSQNSNRSDSEEGLLAVAWKGGPFTLWDTVDWSRKTMPSVPGEQSISSLHFFDGGSKIAIGGNGQHAECSEYPVPENGEAVAATDLEECGCVSIVDVSTKTQLVKPICVPNDIVWNLDVHPRKPQIATAWRSGALRLWDVTDDKLLLVEDVTRHTAAVTKVRFDPEGLRVATSSWDSKILIWDLREKLSSSEPQAINGQTKGVGALDISPDGNLLVSGGEQAKLTLWRSEPGTRGRRTTLAHRDEVCCLVFTQDYLISAGHDGAVKLWGAENLSPIDSYEGREYEVGIPVKIEGLAFYRERDILASGGADGWTRFWRLHNGLLRDSALDIEPTPDAVGAMRVRALGFNPKYDYLMVGSESKKRAVKSFMQDEEVVRFVDAMALGVNFFQGGDFMVTVDGEKELTVWDSSAHQAIGRYLLPSDGSELVVSNDHRFLASTDGVSIVIFDVGEILEGMASGCTLHPVKKFTLHPSGVRSIGFHPEDRYIVAGHQDGAVVVWDLSTGEPAGAPLRGHSVPVRAVAFHPDGDRFASGDNSGNIVLWGMESLSPLEEEACAIINRNLSHGEWRGDIQQDLLGRFLPYRRHCTNLPPGEEPDNTPDSDKQKCRDDAPPRLQSLKESEVRCSRSEPARPPSRISTDSPGGKHVLELC